MLVVLTTSVLKHREESVTVSSFYVSVLYTAMLGTSITAVVLGSLYFCLLDCENPVMVVDCAAVETGCMLETQVKVASKYLFYFFSLVYVVLLCVLLLLLTTSVLKRKEVHTTVSFFSVSAATTAVSFASVLLLLLLVRRDIHFFFFIEVLLLLIIFLVGCAAAAGAAGACAAYDISIEAESGTGYCFFLLRCCPLRCDASDAYCCCCS